MADDLTLAERVVALAVEGVRHHLEVGRRAFMTDVGRPAWKYPLTPEAQLAEYLKMTPEQEAQLRAQRGDPEVDRYKQRMEKMRSSGVWPTDLTSQG